MEKLTLWTTFAALCVIAFSAVVDEEKHLQLTEKDAGLDIEHLIRRLRASVNSNLAHLARMEQEHAQLYPSVKHVDDIFLAGFTTNANDGSTLFRPILPGSRVPSARQFNESDLTPAPTKPESSDGTTTPKPSSGPTPGSPSKDPESADGSNGEDTKEPQMSSEDDSVCFPAHATVQMEGGSVNELRHLRIGDRVLVGRNTYSSVFMFTHRLGDVRHAFVRLTAQSGHEITLTSGHYLYVNDVMTAAAAVQIGDMLSLADGSNSQVTGVESVSAIGLFNPQTVHGDIVVNGVRASTYTRAIEPTTAHALLAPLRTIYERLGLALTCFNDGSDRLANMFPSGSLVL